MGGKNEGLSKLIMMKDFDPDDENDDELVKEVLDTAIATLEVDEARSNHSVFRSALSLLRLLKSRIRNIKSLDYDTYPNHPEFPDVDLSGLMKKMGDFPPLNQVFSPRKIVRLILRLATNSLALGTVLDDVNNAKSQEEAYKACFTKPTVGRFGVLPNLKNFLPPPYAYAVDNWEKDSEFARQFFCGTNPVMIEVAKDPETQLSKNIINHFEKDKLQEMADKNQLLFVSYDD